MVAERRDDRPRLSVVRPLQLVEVDELTRIEQAICRLSDERRVLLAKPRPFGRAAADVIRQVDVLDERLSALWRDKRQALADREIAAMRAARNAARLAGTGLEI